MLLSDNINRLMSSEGITNEKLANYISEMSGENVSHETVRRWRSGKNVPPIDKAQYIAQYFALSLDALMGLPIHTEQQIRLPLVGLVSAGAFDILNEEDWSDTCSVGVQLLADRPKKECVSMKVIGDSMYPYLCENDVLVVHRQTYAVNGNIIVAYDPTLNGFTVKRYKQNGDSVLLEPFNNDYKPIKYNNPTEQILQIYGVCVGMERKLV